MARVRDPEKRKAILREAKRFFARNGYDGSSMGQIAKAAALPVGSLYTYFENKEAIIVAIVEEGWSELVLGLEQGMSAAPSPEARLEFLVHQGLPILLNDVDLITIFFSEAGRKVHLGEKLDSLVLMIMKTIRPLGGKNAALNSSNIQMVKTGLSVFLLGSLETVRLAPRLDLGLGTKDVIAFIDGVLKALFIENGEAKA